ncbi:MAG TPA: hypothetical protein VG938_19140 [Verrucomicrobiae bacterium]|jgi:hypothetical protein|nr:hypothetical protein [Verrucomicrobiae bacterium]
MNLAELQKKLIAVARANPPSDRVPPFFEKRIMALISGRPIYDVWAAWARGLWFAAAPCVAIMLLFSAVAFFHARQPSNPSIDLAQQIDNTLLAAVDQNNNSDSP